MPQVGLAGRRVLVTGAGGFLGSALCRSLGAAGAEVHGVSRRARNTPGVRWHAIDLTHPDAVEQTMADVHPALVYHLASAVSGRRDLEFVGPTLQANLVAAVNVLTAACRTSRPRVLLAGSMEEADADDAGLTPGSPYAAAKTAASMYGRMFHALYGLDVVVLRTFMVYGPGQEDATKLVPYVITSLLEGATPLLSSGAREVDWIYIDDVIDAYLRAGVTAGIAGATIPVGCGELTSVRSVVDRLVQIIGCETQPVFGAVADRVLERPRRAEVALSRSALGWAAQVPLQEGLARTVRWARARSAEHDAIGSSPDVTLT